MAALAVAGSEPVGQAIADLERAAQAIVALEQADQAIVALEQVDPEAQEVTVSEPVGQATREAAAFPQVSRIPAIHQQSPAVWSHLVLLDRERADQAIVDLAPVILEAQEAAVLEPMAQVALEAAAFSVHRILALRQQSPAVQSCPVEPARPLRQVSMAHPVVPAVVEQLEWEQAMQVTD
ncbi:MAG: hypothetical protein ACXWIN_08895 [Burkholderiaceae bacterium]